MNSHHLPVSPHHIEGGIHPADGKGLSQKGTIRVAPLLEKYQLVIQQNIGAPPKLLVKKGDTVKKGQLIAEANGTVSVPLHAPTSGTVGDVLDIPGANGAPVSADSSYDMGAWTSDWYDQDKGAYPDGSPMSGSSTPGSGSSQITR